MNTLKKVIFVVFTIEDIRERIKIVLQKENIPYNEDAVNLIISLADGGMRDALSMLDQVLAYSGDNLDVQDVLNIFALESKEELIDKLTYFGIVLSVIFSAYVIFKKYPMDYVNGVLLVDPIKMQKDMFCGCGGILALLMGSYIDRHFLHYEINFNSKNLPVFTAVGVLLMLGWRGLFYPAILVRAFGILWGNYLGSFIMIFFAVVIWPMVISKFDNE